ncbi:TRAP transporter small permease subunit [Roseicitreum antarcticum]|uniref:TRAP transporter small permease protein n=1 Tax=Roseicitreum antarcticum TaxID=564137 RepID=A0A1H2ULZ5_9RHOB|nr:TRAP transporter small permease subunit [Roseicitreum antarcticum]SDW57153.1 TRAP-type mannitol/chloroaromatic compound transport system, small permease component [Roseicitreum antarcticum]
MPGFLITYVRAVEAFNHRVGRIMMYMIFALMAVLLWGAVSRAWFSPQIWTDEMGQFLLMGYFMLGGAYSLQLGSAVRMDLLYSRWSDRTRAVVDAITILTLLVYLGVLLWGGIESTQYALEYGERRRGIWQPYMAPIKIIMCIGILMMLLQCTAFLIRDIAKLRGREI